MFRRDDSDVQRKHRIGMIGWADQSPLYRAALPTRDHDRLECVECGAQGVVAIEFGIALGRRRACRLGRFEMTTERGSNGRSACSSAPW